MATVVAILMTYSSTSAGLNSGMVAVINAAGKAMQRSLPLGMSEFPGPVERGKNPSRDPVGRSGVWNAVSLASLQYAQLEWGASPEEIGAVASLRPSMPPGDPEDAGGGGAFPWEGRYPCIKLSGYLNTNTGNFLTSEPLISIPSIAGMGLSLTLYHNAQTTWSGTLGPGWSTNYHARIVGPHGSDVVLRWGDGTVIPYDHTQNGYVPPAGIYDKLVWTGDLWLLTKPDQTIYTFYEYDGALHEIEDRHGNQVTIDYEPGVGIEKITAPDGRYINFNCRLLAQVRISQVRTNIHRASSP